MTEDLVDYMAATTPSNTFLSQDPSWAIDFAPNGTLLGVNDTITRLRYAATLEQIANRGADAFYTGPIANATIEAIRRTGGTMTLEDLANYTVTIRQPLNVTYRGYRIFSPPSPASGAVLLGVLKTVEGYDMGNPANLNLSIHRLDEAVRFGYGEVRVVRRAVAVRALMNVTSELSSETRPLSMASNSSSRA